MTDVTHRQHQRHWIGTAAATSDPKWERYAAGTGLIAAACMLASYLLLTAADTPRTGGAALQAFYADAGKRNLLTWSWLMVCFGAAFSAWFLGTLRIVLRRAEGEQGRVSGIGYGAGLASVILFVAGSALMTPIASAMRFDHHFTYDPVGDAHLQSLLRYLSYALLAPAGILAAVLVGATAVVVLRTAVFARWFGITSVVVTVALLLTPFLNLLPVVLIPLWTIAASVLAMRAVSHRDRIVDVTTGPASPAA
ncbi:MAG: hypothetical protein QOG49_425 [Frankiaceae bacterium]|nr:hypothetical protein [Frankiaceae bacterium]